MNKDRRFCRAILQQTVFILALLFPVLSFAQPDTAGQLAELVVTGFRNSAVQQTSMNIAPYPLQQLETRSPLNLSDALAKLPGVSQMTTGNAISKPVIRGLYGNRVLVLLSGLRFDNQQWQDEHGLGLSQIGIDRVELVKGPASLLYGTDAIGGVINVIERIPGVQGNLLDINTRLYTNTRGTLIDAGYAHRKNDNWWRLRGGVETHADYTDGNGTRVLNARNKGYYFKAGFGFDHPRWTMHNAYNLSYNQYGFILDSSVSLQADGRNSRAMTGPHHNVLLNILSSQNVFYLHSNNKDEAQTHGSVLKINAGIQSNKRAEDEGGGQISLDMHLLSLLEQAKWEKKLDRRTSFVLSQQFTYSNNTNLGKRILVPDAHMHEENLSGFIHVAASSLLAIEAGAGFTNKNIRTFKTGLLNGPGKEVQPFDEGRLSGNGMLGLCYTAASHMFVKANIATGVRTANLAELASNGLHEGSYRYEIGDPKLKAEHNLNADISAECSHEQWSLSASVFYNVFSDYIYLAPTTEEFFGFPVFRYRQQNAALYGGELLGSYWLNRSLEAKEVFSLVKGETAHNGNLPFIAPARSTTSIRYEKAVAGCLHALYVEPELEYAFAQNQPAQFETSTPDYTLVHLHMGCDVPIRGDLLHFGLSCRNLLNKTYYDHLSRLKYYGLYNQGINIILSVSTVLPSRQHS